MSEQFSNFQIEHSVQPTKASTETWTDKALREVNLAGAGLSGFGDAAQEAFSWKNLPGTAEKIVGSAVLGQPTIYTVHQSTILTVDQSTILIVYGPTISTVNPSTI